LISTKTLWTSSAIWKLDVLLAAIPATQSVRLRVRYLMIDIYEVWRPNGFWASFLARPIIFFRENNMAYNEKGRSRTLVLLKKTILLIFRVLGGYSNERV